MRLPLKCILTFYGLTYLPLQSIFILISITGAEAQPKQCPTRRRKHALSARIVLFCSELPVEIVNASSMKELLVANWRSM